MKKLLVLMMILMASVASAVTVPPAWMLQESISASSTPNWVFGGTTPTAKMTIVDTTRADPLHLAGSGVKTRLYHAGITTASGTPVTIDVDTGSTNSLFTITVDAMSYLGGNCYYANYVGRGYLFPSGFGISGNALAQSGLTVAFSYVSATTVRVTITDTVDASTKAGVTRILVTSAP